jgi:hypothetical protein
MRRRESDSNVQPSENSQVRCNQTPGATQTMLSISVQWKPVVGNRSNWASTLRVQSPMADDPILKQPASKRADRTIWLITAITGGALLLVAIVTWVMLHIH